MLSIMINPTDAYTAETVIIWICLFGLDPGAPNACRIHDSTSLGGASRAFCMTMSVSLRTSSGISNPNCVPHSLQ